jgi:hypothetical protein
MDEEIHRRVKNSTLPLLGLDVKILKHPFFNLKQDNDFFAYTKTQPDVLDNYDVSYQLKNGEEGIIHISKDGVSTIDVISGPDPELVVIDDARKKKRNKEQYIKFRTKEETQDKLYAKEVNKLKEKLRNKEKEIAHENKKIKEKYESNILLIDNDYKENEERKAIFLHKYEAKKLMIANQRKIIEKEKKKRLLLIEEKNNKLEHFKNQLELKYDL